MTSKNLIGSHQNKISRSMQDLENRFINQMNYLFRSCKSFDAGDEDEFPRIAATLRILLHSKENNGRNTSLGLLSQLNLIEKLNFIDSGIYREQFNLYVESSSGGFKVMPNPSETGLVIPVVENGIPKWKAPLLRNRYPIHHPMHSKLVPPKKFNEWWETSFIETSNNKLFSRKNLVLIAANQDGGAHVDPEIDTDYNDFCNDFFGLEVGADFKSLKPISRNIVSATIRQIAFELMATIDDFKNTDWVKKTQLEIKPSNILPIVNFTLLGM